MFNRESSVRSVLNRAVLRIGLLLGVFIVLLGYYLVDRDYRQQAAEFRNDVSQLAHQLAEREKQISSRVNMLALHSDLHSALQSGNEKQITAWAKSVNSLLPEISGLAVYDVNGNVIGNASEQGITEQSESLVLDYLRENKSFSSSIQDRTHEHWNVAVKVDATDYILLASFPFENITGFIEQSDLTGMTIDLLIDGEVVSRHGVGAGQIEHLVPIGKTGWHLLARAERAALVSVLREPAIILAGILMLMFIMLHIWARKFSEVILKDLRYVRNSASLLATEKSDSVIVEPRLYISEYKDLFAQLKKVILSIHQDTDRAFARDSLTAMSNERELEIQQKKIFEMASRKIDMMMVLLDIDDLNTTNMIFGNKTGDRLIKGVADIIKGAIRVTDECFYLGDGHFLVVLVGMKPAEALKWYEFLTRRYEMLSLNLGEYNETSPEISVSAAAACVSDNDQSLDDTMHRLQKVINSVKQRSKGIIVMARDMHDPNHVKYPENNRKDSPQVEEFHHPWQ